MTEFTVLKQTRNFRLIQSGQRLYVQCLDLETTPRTRRIRPSDCDYLLGLRADFDHACVLDFGVGVFVRRNH